MKTKTYAISGTVEIPEDIDIDEFIGQMEKNGCLGKYKSVGVDIDQIDDISDDEEEEED